MYRLRGVLTVVFAAALAIAACSSDDSSGGSAANTTDEPAANTTDEPAANTTDEPAANTTGESITVSAFTGSPVSTIDQMVVRMGFLEDEGVEAEILEIPSGPDMVASLLGGTAQFTGGAPSFVYNLVDQGECLRYLTPGMGNMYNLVAKAGAMPNAGKGFPESVLDLKGKTVGVVARGSATEVWTRALLSDAGLDPDTDVTFVAVGGGATALPAFEAGQVDAMLSYPPLNQNLAAAGIDFDFLTDTANGSPDTLSDMLQVGTIATCKYADEHPEVITAYCNASAKAHAFLQDESNTDAMVAFMSEILGVDADTAAEIWSEISGSFPADTFSEELFDAQMKYLPDLEQTPDYSEVVIDDCG